MFTTFGAPSPSPFGNTFGTTQTQATNNIFGASTPAATAPSPFGQQSTSFGAQTPATPFGQAPAFGATPTAFGAPATTAFGAPATAGFGAPAPATTGFGAPAPAATAFGATPAFGQNTTAAPAFGAQPNVFAPTTNAFGTTATASPFGAQATTNPFGAPAAAPATTAPTNIFGSSAFGANPTSTPAASPFGAAPSSASPFGAAATPGSMFGANPSPFGTAAPAATSLFGAAAPAFGQQTQPGTRGFVVTTEPDGASNKSNFNSISAMPQYNSKSFEELRYEDYSIGRKGGQPPTVAPTTTPTPSFPFSTPTPAPTAAPAATPNLFGQSFTNTFAAAPAPLSPFAPAPATSAFPTTTSAPFGGGSSFGTSFATPAPAAPATTGFGTFGTPAASTNPFPSTFGAPAPAPAASTFQSTFPAAGGFSFPQTTAPTPAPAPAPAPTTSLFGTSTSTSSSPFGFGSTPAAPATTAATNAPFGTANPFGAPPSTTTFSFPASTPAAAPQTSFAFPTASATSVFPSTSTASPFGLQPAGTNLFGAPSAAPVAPGSFTNNIQQPVQTSINVNPYGASPVPTFAGLPSFSAASPARPSSSVDPMRDFQTQYRFPPHSATRIKPRTPNSFIRLDPPAQVLTPDMFVPRAHSIKHLVIEPDNLQNSNAEPMFKTRAPSASVAPSATSPKPRQNNDSLPKLTGEDYYTIPSLDEMSRMDDTALSQVPNFKVGRKNVGVVEFFGTVDVRKMDLDEIIKFDPRVVTVYNDDAGKPPRGEGLNKPARIMLHNVFPCDKKTGLPKKDAESLARYKQKIQEQMIKIDATLKSYDPATGEWVFDVRGF